MNNTLNKIIVAIDVETNKLSEAIDLIRELKDLGLSKKTLNLLIKDIYKKKDEIREIRAVEE